MHGMSVQPTCMSPAALRNSVLTGPGSRAPNQAHLGQHGLVLGLYGLRALQQLQVVLLHLARLFRQCTSIMSR
jgi:hypothetical protein